MQIYALLTPAYW